MSTPEPYQYPPSTYGTPTPPRLPWWRRGWLQELTAGLVVVATVAGLGAPIGVLWSALAPRVLVQMTSDGPMLTTGEPEEYIGSDAVFTLLGLGLGVLLGLACWFVLRRWRGPVLMAGLTLGCLLGAIVAWQLGRRIGLDDYADLKRTAHVGWQFYRPPSMNSGAFFQVFGWPVFPRGALAAQALAAVFTYTMIAGWSRYPALRDE